MFRTAFLVCFLFGLGASLGCGSDTPPTAPLTQKQLEKEKGGAGGPGGPGRPKSK